MIGTLKIQLSPEEVKQIIAERLEMDGWVVDLKDIEFGTMYSTYSSSQANAPLQSFGGVSVKVNITGKEAS